MPTPIIERNLSDAARNELAYLLRTRDKSLHAALRHFYSMGYTQSQIEWQQEIIRHLNEERKNVRTSTVQPRQEQAQAKADVGAPKAG